MFGGRCVPQHIQQQVIRNYCAQNDLEFLLSGTEYCMGGAMILDAMLEEDIDGIVAYSIFLLPEGYAMQRNMLERCKGASKDMHFAAEGVKASGDDLAPLLDMLQVMEVISRNKAMEQLWQMRTNRI